jgi:hypothetical protein
MRGTTRGGAVGEVGQARGGRGRGAGAGQKSRRRLSSSAKTAYETPNSTCARSPAPPPPPPPLSVGAGPAAGGLGAPRGRGKRPLCGRGRGEGRHRKRRMRRFEVHARQHAVGHLPRGAGAPYWSNHESVKTRAAARRGAGRDHEDGVEDVRAHAETPVQQALPLADLRGVGSPGRLCRAHLRPRPGASAPLPPLSDPRDRRGGRFISTFYF